MTAVVMVADVPSTGTVPGASAIRMPLAKPPDGMTTEQFFDAIASLLEQHQHVVCVYPSWRARRAEHAIGLVRSLISTDKLVGVKSNLPPLALSLNVDLLAHLAQYVPPGVLIAMVSRLAKQTVAGAWLNSVTRFQHAPTSVSEHMRSYLPGSAFVARIAPQPGVTTAAKGAVLQWRPPDPVHLLVASDEPNEDWLRSKLAPELKPAVVRTLPGHPTAVEYWGTAKATEFVAFSAHPDSLTSAVRTVRYRPCSWCGELVAGDPCVFCQMSAEGSTFQPSHTLPANQQLPTAPLIQASGNGRTPAETTQRSEKR